MKQTDKKRSENNNTNIKHKQKRLKFTVVVIVCVIVIALACRVMFDVDMYYHGATLTIRNESRSGYDYLLRIPPGYNMFSGKRPLIIYLHGAGETGRDISELQKGDPSVWSRDYVEPQDYPFITVTPVTATQGWNEYRLKILVEELTSNRDRFAIDETRVYLTGFSMGGFGTFRTAEEYPELFAAIAPVAGGGEEPLAAQLKNVPVWAFHGNFDSCVPYFCSKKMIDGILQAGNKNARLTTFHGADHGIAVDVYRNPKLYQWFLQQKKEERKEE